MHSHRLSFLNYTGPQGKYIKLGAAAVASGLAGSALIHNKERLSNVRLSLNSTLVEAISGAAGEVAQIALVYPLDTVKVRCQAAGIGSRQVFAQLWQSTGGNWLKILAALYAGALPAVPLAVLVGAVHYVSFGASRRALAGQSSTSSSSSKAEQPRSNAAQQQQQQHSQHIVVTHGMTGTHFLPMEDPGGDDQSWDAGYDSSSSPAGAGAAADDEEPRLSQEVGEGSMSINIASAVITAVVTALVEAPLEQFRHNSQAGNIPSNFVKEMGRVLRTAGPRSLYYGFIPYCLESWPYDISELLVVGAASDVRHSPAVKHIKPAAWDLAVGGLAGTVAVLVSMPFDVVKTYMQTHGSSLPTEGLRASTLAFWSTGKALVAKGGPGALFVGLAPRLAHQVPGAMVCWWGIESCQRYLKDCQQQQQQQQQSGEKR